MQQSRQSNTGPRACNTLPGAACSPAAPPPLHYYSATYFLSSILHLARDTAVYIYIILKLPQLSWHFPLPGRLNFVLVHYSPTSRAPRHTSAPLVHHSNSCTSSASLRTTAPLVHHSVLVHLSCTTPYSCTSRAPLVLMHLSCITPYSCSTLDHRYGRPTMFR